MRKTAISMFLLSRYVPNGNILILNLRAHKSLQKHFRMDHLKALATPETRDLKVELSSCKDWMDISLAGWNCFLQGVYGFLKNIHPTYIKEMEKRTLAFQISSMDKDEGQQVNCP